MPLEIYLSYSSAYVTSFEDFVRRAATQGFAGVELIPDLSPNLLEQFPSHRRQELARTAQNLGLHVTVHNVYMDINPTSLVPAVRQFALDLTFATLEFAKDMDARWLVMHTGYRFGAWRSKPDQARMFEQNLAEIHYELANYSAAVGIPILLENGSYYLATRYGQPSPLHIGIECEELISLARIPASAPFGICLDIGKAYLSVEGRGAGPVIEYVTKTLPLLREVHIGAFPDYAEILPEVLRYLDDNRFDGPVVLECGQDDLEPLLNVVKSTVLGERASAITLRKDT